MGPAPEKDWRLYQPVPTLEAPGPPAPLRRALGRLGVLGLTAGLVFLALTGCGLARYRGLWQIGPATRQEVKALAICATGSIPDGTGACAPAPALQPLPRSSSAAPVPPPAQSATTAAPPERAGAALHTHTHTHTHSAAEPVGEPVDANSAQQPLKLKLELAGAEPVGAGGGARGASAPAVAGNTATASLQLAPAVGSPAVAALAPGDPDADAGLPEAVEIPSRRRPMATTPLPLPQSTAPPPTTSPPPPPAQQQQQQQQLLLQQQQLAAAISPVPADGETAAQVAVAAPVPGAPAAATTAATAAATAAAVPAGQELVFYMYRAQDDQNYVVQNVNTATLAGVMWYLEKEVVRGYCPRHYDITRILRFRVTVRQPPGLEHNFSRFVAFDSGRCTTPGCMADFQQHGYSVGCQRQLGAPYGPNPVWYSLPGSCPSVDFHSKTPACEIAEPGGRCATPTGAKDCTWSLQDAGEISIAELEGIPDYNAFCLSKGNEYTMPFWEGRGNPQYNEVRMQKTKNLFRSKYPSMPDLPDPDCDWL